MNYSTYAISFLGLIKLTLNQLKALDVSSNGLGIEGAAAFSYGKLVEE
jgi:hypothetical protein